MDNQQQKITGYRDLSDAEIAAMNEVKALGIQAEAQIERARAAGADPRWLAIAATDLQKALMFLARAIAKPTTF